MPKRSLSIEIQEFFDSLGKDLESSTKGAFSLQRTKLQAVFFEVWNNWLVQLFYHHYGIHVQTWRGFLLQAVDGSTMYLHDRKDVVAYFGTQDNQHVSVPMARVMEVYDILNNIIVWGSISPIKESEQSMMNDYVSNLCEHSITMFDRGYPSYALMYLMINQETPRHFVMRCKVGFNAEVKQFVNSREKSNVIEIRPGSNAIATLKQYGYIVTSNTAIKIRMVKVKLNSGETEVLLTNLYDEKQYTIADLSYLYSLRWGIETSYGKQKNQMQLEQFSGHRVICIQQDYFASIFVSNLQSLIEKQCDDYLHQIHKRRKYRYRINRNVSWACLKNNIIKLFIDKNPKQILVALQIAFEQNIEPIRPARHYPRIRKFKRTNGKYQTFTNYKRAI